MEQNHMDDAIEDIMKLKVDVIIPVYKPDSKFKILIERLVKQTIKPNRIILLDTLDEIDKEGNYVNGPATKEAITYVQTYAAKECPIDCYPIRKPEFDHGGTRNYGATLSSSDILVFMTQDAVPADGDLIKNLLKPFRNEKVGAAYARQLANDKAGVIEQYTRVFNYPDKSSIKSFGDKERLGIKTYFCSNVCAAYRKSVYSEIGGFPLKTIFNEDMIMASQIIGKGYIIAYQAEAKVYHSHKYTYIEQFKRNFDLAVSQKQYSHIFAGVKSENEGIKLVTKTLSFLIQNGKIYLLPDLFLQSGFKYLGYKAGKMYDKFPNKLRKVLSMNPSYWDLCN